MKMDPLDIEQQLAADQRRGRYVRVSDTDRRQLIDAYKKNEDFIALAKKLNIKRSTARSILRTYIDEGRISAKQRAGTRLRFITEDEAEIIRDMKRRHPLITIGQIQMRLQRTSNRVLSKASISRILTNSIRLGKRAKRSIHENDDGSNEPNNRHMSGQDDMGQGSSDEGTEGMFYIDEEDDEDDDEDDDPKDESSGQLGGSQNLEDFQRFMLRKASMNGDESTNHQDHYEHNDPSMYENNYSINYQNFNSDGEDEELSEVDENESKSPNDAVDEGATTRVGDTSTSTETGNWNGHQSSVKSEPVCVFLNQNYDSSDSETPCTVEDRVTKPLATVIPTSSSNGNNRRIKLCPICGEKNFSKLAHHLAVVHNMNRQESLTVLAHAGRKSLNPTAHSMIASASGSSPKMMSNTDLDKSPQPTPISITTNNQQITSESSPTFTAIESETTSITNNNETGLQNFSPVDGKKRLLCPQCETWVLNLTDHLIKKHHLLSKQDRLPYLRLARTRQNTNNNDKLSTSSFIIPSEQNIERQKSFELLQAEALNADRKYQQIVKKFRKNEMIHNQASSSSHGTSGLTTSNGEHSSNLNNQNLLSINNMQNMLSSSVSPQERACQSIKRTSSTSKTNGTTSAVRDVQQMAIHQKFEQRLSVFRQQFAVTVAMQNSLMQQMELLQRSFVSIEDEWNDMKTATDAVSS